MLEDELDRRDVLVLRALRNRDERRLGSRRSVVRELQPPLVDEVDRYHLVRRAREERLLHRGAARRDLVVRGHVRQLRTFAAVTAPVAREALDAFQGGLRFGVLGLPFAVVLAVAGGR